jgi:hypothetical protein
LQVHQGRRRAAELLQRFRRKHSEIAEELN